MIKALAVGLGLVLSSGVAFAQSKRAPQRKPPASAPRSGDPQPAAAPASPVAGGTSGDGSGTPPPARPDTAAPATPAAMPPAIPGTPAATPPATSAATPPGAGTDTTPPAAGAAGKKPAPMKTSEKAGTNEALQKTAGYKTVSEQDEKYSLAAFRQGNDLLNNGLFPQAVARYRDALGHWDHPAIHYNLALALINLDQPIEVFDQLNEAIKYGEDPVGQDKFIHAKEYLKLVAGQLADVEVSCEKPGAKIAVDGKEVFVAPGSYKGKVRVGKHTFFGDKEGYNARVTAPFIGPGETFRIELKLYTSEELTRYRRKWDRTWMPYTVMGAGAFVGIVGGLFELGARANYKTFDTGVARCNTMAMGCPSDTPGLLDTRNSGNTKRAIGYVGYSIAGATIVTGAVMAWLNRRQPYQVRPEELEEQKDRGSVAFTPIVSPEMAGAMVQGHF